MCGHKIATTATNNSDFFQTIMTDQELTHLTLKLINRRVDDDDEGGYMNILDVSLLVWLHVYKLSLAHNHFFFFC